MPTKAIRPVGTLHLTLGVMSLPQKESVDKAVELLKTLAPRQIAAAIRVPDSSSARLPEAPDGMQTSTGSVQLPLSVTLRGLHSPQSASKATVLYASPADDDGTLYKFCEQLRQPFREAGLITEERPLLLHATIVNTIYVGGRGSRGKRHTIDAKSMLDRYSDFVWMENVPIETAAICRMGAKKLDDGDEAYEVEAEINMAPTT